MPEVVRIYRGSCGGCDLLVTWRLTGDDDRGRLVPPAAIPIGHLCEHPAREIDLIYQGEVDS